MKYSVRRYTLPSLSPAFLLCILYLASWLPDQAPAQEDHCDPYLKQIEDNPLGYRVRGDRCEGIYIKEVGSTALLIASLTNFFDDFDFTTDKELLIKWELAGSRRVYLRAHSLKRRLYYRMDTVRPSGTTNYKWPTNVLAALNIRRKDIGVIGWCWHTIKGEQQRVYLPLRLERQSKPRGSNTYQIVLLPGRELEEVFVSLAQLGADGHPDLFLVDGKPLGYGYYPAGRGITIPIGNLQKAGVYYLELGAVLRGGGTDTVELFFYYLGS
ncbi:MAG: hypothetical protein PVG41_15820 [Desulfobacteraceae bacterium]|jgi:hypothetical protein